MADDKNKKNNNSIGSSIAKSIKDDIFGFVKSASGSNNGELLDDLDDNADYTVIPKKPLLAVKDIGFVEEMNQKYRRTMEVRIYRCVQLIF